MINTLQYGLHSRSNSRQAGSAKVFCLRLPSGGRPAGSGGPRAAAGQPERDLTGR
jgi:hypothetical protein